MVRYARQERVGLFGLGEVQLIGHARIVLGKLVLGRIADGGCDPPGRIMGA